MTVSKQRKAGLDKFTLEFNQWATAVLQQLEYQSNRDEIINVGNRTLMVWYLTDTKPAFAAKAILRNYRSKTGG